MRHCFEVKPKVSAPAIEAAVDETPENEPLVIGDAVLGTTGDQERLAMALLTGKKWNTGRTLRIGFMDGKGVVIDRVKRKAEGWLQYANLKFTWVDDPDAEIRITFNDEGSWSYLGTDALTIPKSEPTMCYGWLTPEEDDTEYQRVVLHEFGHALGAIHEHQNPGAAIPWDKEAVYRYYMGPPNHWSKADVDHNLFERYSETQSNFTEFDRLSIMAYAIPNELTLGDYFVPWNTTLSDQDKQFIAIQYPKSTDPAPPVTSRIWVALTTLARYPGRYFGKNLSVYTYQDGRKVERWRADAV